MSWLHAGEAALVAGSVAVLILAFWAARELF